MKTDPNDFAYPRNNYECDINAGLTKREHFAAMAMQSFVAYGRAGTSFHTVAEDAVRQADALIAALNDLAARKETP